EELDEAADVRVVERRLDLVEKIERARPGEEQREEEGDRAERLLAAGEKREPLDALAGGTQLDLDARPFRFLLGVGLRPPQAALAAGEDGRSDALEVAPHGVEGLGEATLDCLRQLGAELFELGEACLEIRALGDELLEPHLFGLVLLVCERIDLAESL